MEGRDGGEGGMRERGGGAREGGGGGMGVLLGCLQMRGTRQIPHK